MFDVAFMSTRFKIPPEELKTREIASPMCNVGAKINVRTEDVVSLWEEFVSTRISGL